MSFPPSRTRERLQSVLGNRFTVEREIGGGGMSETFLARDLTLGRSIVVKVLAPALADGVNLERFSREIAISATLQHPNLVPVLDTGVVDGLPFFTMPFVAGESLRQRLDGTVMPISDALSILRDVARGLGAAHAKGVVHRDVKPDNVLLSGDAAVVTDLGIARALASSGDAPTLTRTGMAMGTPAYFAPEQASGDTVDGRADWYAFGVMAFEMFTGRLPFTAPTDAGLLVAHVTTPAPDILGYRPDLPASLAALVMRCLAKEPAERPATSEEIVRALDAANSGNGTGGGLALGQPILAGVGAVEATSAGARRSGRTLAFAGAAVIALVTAGWWGRDRMSTTVSNTRVGQRGPRPMWIAILSTSDVERTQRLRRLARNFRERIPGVAGVELVSVDTVLGDTEAAAKLARTKEATVLLIGESRTLRGGDTTRTWGALFNADGSGGCELEERRVSRDASPPLDVVERVLGVLAIRYDALLVQRYMRGARLVGREEMCPGYRLDALRLLAAYRADTLRSATARIADLAEALKLDSAFLEARVELARAKGDTNELAVLRSQMEGSAVGRLELEVTKRLERAPLEALDLAERGRETGQVSAGTLARVYLTTGRARRALAVLESLDADEVEQAGGKAIVAAMQASAYFQLGDDAAALQVLVDPSPADVEFYAGLRLVSRAALGDSSRWSTDWLQLRRPPETRLSLLLRSAGAAAVAGRAALARYLYARANDEGEVLLQGTAPSPYLALAAAEARRRVGDDDGAVELLQRLRGDRDSIVVARAEAKLALVALERADERLAREMILRVDQRALRAPGWRSSLMLARLESTRGRLDASANHLRRAIALGLPREYASPFDDIGDLRTDADLAALFATPKGRALMLASD